MNKSWLRSGLLYFILLVGAVILFTSIFSPLSKKTPTVPFYELVSAAQTKQIDVILQQGDTLIGLKSDQEILKNFFRWHH